MDKTFSPTIEIVNGTDYDIDTTLLTIADKILELDTLTIRVYYSRITLEQDGVIVNNFAIKNVPPHDYSIFVGKELNKAMVRKVIAHEMAHIKQYESGRLIEIDKGIMQYDGKIINLSKTEYKNRPFEIDAFNEQGRILSMLNRIVYN